MAKEVYVIPGQMDIFDFISDPEDNRIKIEDAKVLSLFDGMACAMISLLGCEIKVSRYVAYEVDKYAVKTSSHNFPMIEHRGDVFDADFTEFEGFDLLMGGSPCTYWSIAQTKNRETVASGMGWELFSQYVRALKEAKPKAFIYENNKSMSKQIRQSICETFGFEPICINSALVSAQNRNRLYWVGVRQDNGTYKRVNVQQPEDRGILLKHILESGTSWLEKSQTIDAHHYAGGNLSNLKKQSGKRLMAAEPVNVTADGKSQTIKAQYAKSSIANFFNGDKGNLFGASGVAERVEFKSLTTKKGYAEVKAGDCVDLAQPNSKTRRGRLMPQGGESNCLTTGCAFFECCGTIEHPIYLVKDGMITVKGKTYPIKLVDGYYIIRKLTVLECMRLQTVPEWYVFPVSNSQAYKMLGNGWTIEVIKHLVNSIIGE